MKTVLLALGALLIGFGVLKGKTCFIGAALASDNGCLTKYDRVLDHVLILWAFPDDSQFAKSGLRVGDKITAVDGKDVAGMRFEGVIDAMNGQEGTSVKIVVRRNGVASLLTFNVTRYHPIIGKH